MPTHRPTDIRGNYSNLAHAPRVVYPCLRRRASARLMSHEARCHTTEWMLYIERAARAIAKGREQLLMQFSQLPLGESLLFSYTCSRI